MKTVILKNITLINWRAQNTVVDLYDHTTEISGMNQSGKSTIYNAFLWLMTGCDEYDRMNFRLFDDTIEHTKETDSPSSVVAILSIDGIEYKLERKASMGWTRKRGKTEWERKGSDNYTFAIDDIDRSASEYKKFIEEMILPIDKLKICINIGYLLSLDWKEMRKRFEDMVGEINIEDFKGDYSGILDDLNKYGVDDLKTRYRNIIKRLGKEVDDLPVAIETLFSNLPDLEVIEQAELSLKERKEELSKLSDSILDAIPHGVDDMRREMDRMTDDFKRSERAYKMENDKELKSLEDELYDMEAFNRNVAKRNADNDMTIARLRGIMDKNDGEILSLKNKKADLLKKCKKIKVMEFDGYKCPYCGQELSDDMLEKTKSDFYSNRDSEYNDIVARGKEMAKEIEKLEYDNSAMKGTIEELSKKQEQKDTSDLLYRIEHFYDNIPDYGSTPEGKEKSSKIADMRCKLEGLCHSNNIDGLSSKREGLIREVESLSRVAGKREEYDRINARISEMRKKLRDQSNEKATMEGMLDKLSMFEREKASIVSERVNMRMEYASVRMTEVNKSGEIVDTCVVLDKEGVSYPVTNSASRMRCGIDVARSFSRLYGVSLPLFIDNAERLDSYNIPDHDGQVILLRVSDDKTLKIK